MGDNTFPTCVFYFCVEARVLTNRGQAEDMSNHVYNDKAGCGHLSRG